MNKQIKLIARKSADTNDWLMSSEQEKKSLSSPTYGLTVTATTQTPKSD